MLEAISLPQNSPKESPVGKEKSSPRFNFIPVGSPDMPILGIAEPVRSHFNPGIATVKIGSLEIGVAISRIMTDEHDDAKADKTNYLSITTYEKNTTNLNPTVLGVIRPETLLSDEQIAEGYNLEDFRLTYLSESNTLVGCMSVVSPQDSQPNLGYVIATPQMKDGELALNFGKVVIVKDEKGELIKGKNNILRVAPNGNHVMLYRPEFLLENGERKENYDTFRFVSVAIDTPDAPSEIVGKDMILPKIGDSRARWGWNGNNGLNDIKDAEGNSLCVIHYDKKGPTPEHPGLDDTYTFKIGKFKEMDDGSVVCLGVYEDDFLTPDMLKEFTHAENDLNPKKIVIYSPGSDRDQATQTLILGVTYEDTGWGFITVPIEDVRAFVATRKFISAVE